MTVEQKSEKTDEVCGNENIFFLDLDPIEGAIDAINKLSSLFDTYFLSAAMWNVPQNYTEKRLWIKKHFGNSFRNKIIMANRKDWNMGDFLIDD